MINPERFMQSKNAARAFQATLIVLQMLGLQDSFIVLDSKTWQHRILGRQTQSSVNLKQKSMQIGIKFMKMMKCGQETLDKILKHGDADGLLMAVYVQGLGNSETHEIAEDNKND